MIGLDRCRSPAGIRRAAARMQRAAAGMSRDPERSNNEAADQDRRQCLLPRRLHGDQTLKIPARTARTPKPDYSLITTLSERPASRVSSGRWPRSRAGRGSWPPTGMVTDPTGPPSTGGRLWRSHSMTRLKACSTTPSRYSKRTDSDAPCSCHPAASANRHPGSWKPTGTRANALPARKGSPSSPATSSPSAHILSPTPAVVPATRSRPPRDRAVECRISARLPANCHLPCLPLRRP